MLSIKNSLMPIYSGTLHGQWEAIVALQQLIALSDIGGNINMAPAAIAARTSIPLEIIERGIERLLEPDPHARYEFQRRGHIERADDGFHICGIHQFILPVDRPLSGWAALRAEIFERDGYQCQYCGHETFKLECDHVFPASRGGSNDPDNLTTACIDCNRSKGARTPEEWLGVAHG